MDAARRLSNLVNGAPASVPHSSFSTSISPTAGFHTKSVVSIQYVSSTIPQNHCLYILFILPLAVFVDPYELEQRWRDRYLPPFKVWGETNLELPLEAVDKGGSAVLLSLHPEFPTHTIEVPFHMRYMAPVNGDASSVSTHMPWPSVFWGSYEEQCTISENIDSLNIGNRTSIFVVRPSASQREPFYTISVPTGNLSFLPIVEYGTFGAVLVAFIYISFNLWVISLRMGNRVRNGKRKVE